MLLFLFLGAPGSGKGTLSQKLVQNYGFTHFSTGKIFRLEKNKLQEKGTLINDDYVNSLVLRELNKIFSKNPDAKVILDGYPRTKVQAEFIRNYFSINKVFHLTNISNEFLIGRISNRVLCEKEDHSFNLIFHPPRVPGICDFDGSKLYRRSDDSHEIVKKRLEVYDESTRPLIDYYREHGELIELDASLPLPELLKSLVDKL